MLKLTEEVLETFQTEAGGYPQAFIEGCKLLTGESKWRAAILDREITGTQAKLLRQLAMMSNSSLGKRAIEKYRLERDRVLLELELTLSH